MYMYCQVSVYRTEFKTVNAKNVVYHSSLRRNDTLKAAKIKM